MNQETLLRYLALILLTSWSLLWKIKSKEADKAKPRLKKDALPQYISSALFWTGSVIIFFQLLGLPIFPMPYDWRFQIAGLVLILIGISVSVAGRMVLDTNWTNAHQYQIKKNHELVTGGIYKYIRHPIYTGIILAGTGTELVVSSKLFLPTLFVTLMWSYIQARKEEKLLSSFFKKKYIDYMSRTKRFIPFLF